MLHHDFKYHEFEASLRALLQDRFVNGQMRKLMVALTFWNHFEILENMEMETVNIAFGIMTLFAVERRFWIRIRFHNPARHAINQKA